MLSTNPPKPKSRGIQAILGALGAVASAVLASPYAGLIPPKIGLILTAIGAAIAAGSYPPRPKKQD